MTLAKEGAQHFRWIFSRLCTRPPLRDQNAELQPGRLHGKPPPRGLEGAASQGAPPGDADADRSRLGFTVPTPSPVRGSFPPLTDARLQEAPLP